MDTFEKPRNMFFDRDVASLYLNSVFVIVTWYAYIICNVFIDAELYKK